MEPRLERLVPTHALRVEILNHVYCEAKRDPTLPLPPDLVLALIEVESVSIPGRFRPAGAVGLMCKSCHSGRANWACKISWCG